MNKSFSGQEDCFKEIEKIFSSGTESVDNDKDIFKEAIFEIFFNIYKDGVDAGSDIQLLTLGENLKEHSPDDIARYIIHCYEKLIQKDKYKGIKSKGYK